MPVVVIEALMVPAIVILPLVTWFKY